MREVIYPNPLWFVIPMAMWWVSHALINGLGLSTAPKPTFVVITFGVTVLALFLFGFYWLLRFALDCVPLTLTDQGIGLCSLTFPRHETRIRIQWAHVYSLTLESDAGFGRSRLSVRLDGRSYIPIIPLGHDSKAVARKIIAVATSSNWRIRVDPVLEAWLKA